MNTSMSCDFAHHDGAYVLGSLSPAERSEFERHLAGCEDCARAVRELAGLPGLLARVSPDVLESVGAPEPVPPSLLPALVSETRRSQRRRTTVLVGLAAAAALVVAGGSAVALNVFDEDPVPAGQSAPPSGTPGEPMTSVGSESVSGTLALTSVAWGTRLDLVCTYAPDHEATYGATYAMVVRTRDGRVEQVATWMALPGKAMRLPGATSATLTDIASVEVLTADGEPVLTLTE
ncbi:MAG: zf-HC2 domain-containing protein [Nocardioides sp.]|nr:zf-HC2 domain-containing protein [Nocardioides sp.]